MGEDVNLVPNKFIPNLKNPKNFIAQSYPTPSSHSNLTTPHPYYIFLRFLHPPFPNTPPPSPPPPPSTLPRPPYLHLLSPTPPGFDIPILGCINGQVICNHPIPPHGGGGLNTWALSSRGEGFRLPSPDRLQPLNNPSLIKVRGEG